MPTKKEKPRGQIPVGTPLTHRRRDGTEVQATVTEGGVRMGGKDYRSINAAAMAAGGGRPVDAWRYWRLADGRLLDALRVEPAPRSPARPAKAQSSKGGKRKARRVKGATG